MSYDQLDQSISPGREALGQMVLMFSFNFLQRPAAI